MFHSLEKISQDLENRLGRPFGTFKLSIEDVKTRIEDWVVSFEEGGEREGQIPTISSLAYDLGICRRTLVDYQHRDAYKPMLDRAKTFCEMHVEQKLFDPKIRPAGPIFNLKANYGWKDGSQLDVNVNLSWSAALREAEKQRKELNNPGPDTPSLPES